jgi:PIN domain-containing protein
MGTVVVVADTNIVQTSPGLSSPAWTGLINTASDWGLHFRIPAVVELETVNNVRRSWQEKRNKVVNLKIAGFGVDESKQAIIDGIDARIERYADELRDRLLEIGAQVIPVPDSIDVMEHTRI